MADETKQGTKQVKPGKTFNIKKPNGKTPEGKVIWEKVRRAFIRDDGSGGVLYVGEGEAQREYALFPAVRKAKPAAATATQPAASGAAL